MNLKQKIARLCVLGAATLGFVKNAASDYIWHQFQGNSYALTNYGTWQEAENEAVSAGGHLVTINSNDENNWLASTFDNAYTREGEGVNSQNIAWIGLSRGFNIPWQWASGQMVKYWGYKDPNFDGSDTTIDYMYLQCNNHPSSRKWETNPNYSDYHPRGIIEIGDETQPDYGWYFYNGHKYALIGFNGAWQEAENEAVVRGGHLVTINNAEENNWLKNTFRDFPNLANAWIGMSREAYQDFSWVSGENIDYWNWIYGSNVLDGDGILDYMYLDFDKEKWNSTSDNRAQFNGIMEIIPEPSTLGFLGLGGLAGLLGAGIKKKKEKKLKK